MEPMQWLTLILLSLTMLAVMRKKNIRFSVISNGLRRLRLGMARASLCTWDQCPHVLSRKIVEGPSKIFVDYKGSRVLYCCSS
jgi:hypothetical protein